MSYLEIMFAFLVSLVLASALSLPASGQSTAPVIRNDANPAMWKIKGVHGTIYLFGTVHVMRKEVVWETPKVKAAFKSSDALYLEIADISDDAMKAMQPMILKLGIDAEHPLSTKISREDVALLDGEAKKLGMPGEQAFEPMKPWLATLSLDLLPVMQAGFDPATGIDKVLQADAKAQGKPVRGFETMEQQMHFIADNPEPDQVAMLHDTLVDLPKSVPELNEIVADWTRGDVEKIGAIDNDQVKRKHPALYQKLIVERNADFTAQLTRLLKDPATGTLFVAIGAGHLAGPDSVLRMLEKSGFTATREQ